MDSYKIIQDVMHINWSDVRWTDLTKPLYSGIAAALYTILRRGSGEISWKSEEQGTFWATNFHGGQSRAYNFTQLASILDQGIVMFSSYSDATSDAIKL